MTEIVKASYGFTAGEVSPNFYGRADLTKYNLGVGLAHNLFVDYRGGLVSRAGTKFVGGVENSNDPMRLVKFSATFGDYLLLFAPGYIRPLRNNGYLLEADKAITSIVSGTFTCAAHGYAVNDVIYLTGVAAGYDQQYYRVDSVTTNTFTVTQFGRPAVGAVSDNGPATCARTVRIATTYTAADIPLLSFEQNASTIAITSPSAPVRELLYVDDVTWTLSAVNFSPATSRPGQPTLSPSSGGTAGYAFAVTAVVDGVESLPSPFAYHRTSVNYSATAGFVKVTWPAVAGQVSEYRIYRSIIFTDGAQANAAQDLGYVGKSYSTTFIDNNIVPDFTKTPPVGYNPFEAGAIIGLTVLTQSGGFSANTTVTVTDAAGTGFAAEPIVDTSGNLISLRIISGGRGYVSPTFSFSPSGTATFDVALSPATGNWPSIKRTFQQRAVYAGSTRQPLTVWGSRADSKENFSFSPVLNAADSYELTLDSETAQPLRHLIALRVGLLAFSSAEITLIRSEEGKAISPLNNFAEIQAFKGASKTAPAKVDSDVLFAQEDSSSLNALIFTEYTTASQLQDVSILASHLMGVGKRVTRLEWVPEPNKILWCLREDGALLSLTYERQQEVFAWAQHWTRGQFTDICSVQEADSMALYVIARRKINGTWYSYLEAMQPREFNTVEEYWGVDSGLAYEMPHPAASIDFSALSGTATVTADAGVFSVADVDKILYAGGGKIQITGYVSPTEVVGFWLRNSVASIPETSPAVPATINEGLWQMGAPVSELLNLSHLEGEKLSVLLDGDAYTDLQVIDGKVTLPRAGTRIVAGLGYTCKGTTLPFTVQEKTTEHLSKQVLAVHARVKDSRGLAFGEDFTRLYEVKGRLDEAWGEQLAAQNGVISMTLNSGQQLDATVSFSQSYPLPVTILSLVVEVDLEE